MTSVIANLPVEGLSVNMTRDCSTFLPPHLSLGSEFESPELARSAVGQSVLGQSTQQNLGVKYRPYI